MAIAVISAILIHVVWLNLRYEHVDIRMMRRVKGAAFVLSLALTIVLFCLIAEYLEQVHIFEKNFEGGLAGHPIVSVVASPDNSACYAEIHFPK